jgi:hypothetical protein
MMVPIALLLTANVFAQDSYPVTVNLKPEQEVVPVHGPGFDGGIWPCKGKKDSKHNCWIPTLKEIRQAEKGLGKFILDSRNGKELSAPLTDYVRNYYGVYEKGKMVIHINLLKMPHKDWNEDNYKVPVWTCYDCGDESLSLKYDVQTGCFFDYWESASW